MALLKLVFMFYGLSIEFLLHVDVVLTVEVHLSKNGMVKCSPGVLSRGVYWDLPKL